jgi:hypothetical protein
MTANITSVMFILAMIIVLASDLQARRVIKLGPMVALRLNSDKRLRTAQGPPFPVLPFVLADHIGSTSDHLIQNRLGTIADFIMTQATAPL